MPKPLVLASGSEIRAEMLRRAGLSVAVMPARLDEDSVKQGMLAEDAAPRDIADLLAEMKAAKVAGKRPDALVLGCDQVLDFEGAAAVQARIPGSGGRAALGNERQAAQTALGLRRL